MFKLGKGKKNIIIDLGEYVLENGVMPVPTYSKSKEKRHIIQPRGVIFTKFRKALKYR